MELGKHARCPENTWDLSLLLPPESIYQKQRWPTTRQDRTQPSHHIHWQPTVPETVAGAELATGSSFCNEKITFFFQVDRHVLAGDRTSHHYPPVSEAIHPIITPVHRSFLDLKANVPRTGDPARS
jgi:hypothetical protein